MFAQTSKSQYKLEYDAMITQNDKYSTRQPNVHNGGSICMM